METLQRIKNVAACDVYQVGDLLACPACATSENVILQRYTLTGLDAAWCDYCGRDLIVPRMFDTTPHAL